MREISAQQITEAVKRLCIHTNCHLSGDIKSRIAQCREQETWPQAKEILERIIENYQIADEQDQPLLIALSCILVLFCTKSMKAFGRSFLMVMRSKDYESSQYQESLQSVKMVMMIFLCFSNQSQ